MRSASISTERLSIQFGANGQAVPDLAHAALGNVLVDNQGRHALLLRTPKAISEPVFLRRVTSFESHEGAVAFRLTDSEARHQARLRVAASEGGLHFSVQVEAAEPVWLVEWTLHGLALEEVIVPALGGQAINKGMPIETEIAYKYPFWWNAQFALGALNDRGGLWLRTQDAAPRFKLLRVYREASGAFALTLGFEVDAPLTARTFSAEWYLDGYDEGWQHPVEAHRRWLKEVYDLVSPAEHPHCPDWMRRIDVVLEIWGMNKREQRPAHTFEEMIGRLEDFARLHAPETTLLYLPGFAENGIDGRAPDYSPGRLLGGNPAFGRLVRAAHRLGYRVMIHTNVLGMTYGHPLFDRFRAHQVIDAFGRPQGWGLDLDGDWLPEPYFAYMNPAAPEWSELTVERLGALIRRFDLDAVFLDQTLLAFNVSNGPNFIEGMRAHIRRLQRAFPHVLFAGEGMHEQVLPVLPVAQIHGIDSIANVHGLDGRAPWRQVHPVSMHLFGPHVQFLPHLLTRHPSHPYFAEQERAYAKLGIMPALVLFNRTQAIDIPPVRALLERARQASMSTSPL